MATRGQADQARALHADGLAKQGAHAVGVEPGKAYGKSGFVVVAYIEPNKAVSLPEKLTLETDLKSISVPLVIEKAGMFKAE